jgi:hypothetical protein
MIPNIEIVQSIEQHDWFPSAQFLPAPHSDAISHPRRHFLKTLSTLA